MQLPSSNLQIYFPPLYFDKTINVVIRFKTEDNFLPLQQTNAVLKIQWGAINSESKTLMNYSSLVSVSYPQ